MPLVRLPFHDGIARAYSRGKNGRMCRPFDTAVRPIRGRPALQGGSFTTLLSLQRQRLVSLQLSFLPRHPPGHPGRNRRGVLQPTYVYSGFVHGLISFWQFVCFRFCHHAFSVENGRFPGNDTFLAGLMRQHCTFSPGLHILAGGRATGECILNSVLGGVLQTVSSSIKSRQRFPVEPLPASSRTASLTPIPPGSAHGSGLASSLLAF